MELTINYSIKICYDKYDEPTHYWYWFEQDNVVYLTKGNIDND